jgi:hypothetical protein
MITVAGKMMAQSTRAKAMREHKKARMAKSLVLAVFLRLITLIPNSTKIETKIGVSSPLNIFSKKPS